MAQEGGCWLTHVLVTSNSCQGLTSGNHYRAGRGRKRRGTMLSKMSGISLSNLCPMTPMQPAECSQRFQGNSLSQDQKQHFPPHPREKFLGEKGHLPASLTPDATLSEPSPFPAADGGALTHRGLLDTWGLSSGGPDWGIHVCLSTDLFQSGFCPLSFP